MSKWTDFMKELEEEAAKEGPRSLRALIGEPEDHE